MQQTFVGAVEGTGIYLALQTAASGAAQAYLCDSTDVARLLSGRVTDGAVTLDGENATALTAQLTVDTATGTVTVDGTQRSFTATLAQGDAGFYRAAGDGFRIGWVLLNDGTQRGGQTDTSSGKVRSAPRLGGDGQDVDAGGKRATAKKVEVIDDTPIEF